MVASRGIHGRRSVCPHAPSTIADMLIRIAHHELVDGLCAHYRRSGFDAEAVGGGMVEVTRPDAPTDEQARYEVLLHLRIWQVANPDEETELLQ